MKGQQAVPGFSTSAMDEQEGTPQPVPDPVLSTAGRLGNLMQKHARLESRQAVTQEALDEAGREVSRLTAQLAGTSQRLEEEQQANALMADRLKELLERPPAQAKPDEDVISKAEHVQKVRNQGSMIAALKHREQRLLAEVAAVREEASQGRLRLQETLDSARELVGTLRSVIWLHGRQDGAARVVEVSDLEELAGASLLMSKVTEKPPVKEYRVVRRDKPEEEQG
jgi:chromosome segregation ATPase